MIMALIAGSAAAKKAPGPESIVPKKPAQQAISAARPLQNEYTADGFASRLFYPPFVTQKSQADDIVADFLSRNNAILGIEKDFSDLKALGVRRSLAGNHYRYQQMYNGIPVFASQLLINVTDGGIISSVSSDLRHGIEISTTPSISATFAENAALAEIGALNQIENLRTELVVYPFEREPVLCWLVSFVADSPLGDWQVFVDAQDGSIAAKNNIMRFIDGHGYSFNPNPVVSEQNLMLADSSDQNYLALTNARDTVALRDLNAPQGGYYYLTGPYVNTTPTSNRARFTSADSFYYNRLPDQFEEVNVYFHIDSCERFYQTLGFTDVMMYSISIAVNGTTDDNSWYTPSQHRITYGSGGVDDAEDGDVIIHEYGHATQDDQVPNWGQTEEGGAMGEGFGDYLTVGFFHPVSGNWREAYVFDWDANTRDNFWPGRRVDRNKHYPEDFNHEVHDDGEIWSRCLWDIQNGIGYDTTVQLVVESHFGLTAQANFDDGANAIIEADINLYGGRHLMVIGEAFVDRGILTELPVQLDISHQPLTDTENMMISFPLIASIAHTFPVNSLTTFYKLDSDSTFDQMAMTPTGNLDEYEATIPAPGLATAIRYYFEAIDSIGVTATLPEGAPTETFQFYVGPDTVHPVLTHQQLSNWPSIRWPPTLRASATDNIGIDSVYAEFRINDGSWIIAPFAPIDTNNNWSGPLSGIVEPGDTVQYRVAAKDASLAGNLTYLPVAGYYSFTILDLQSRIYMAEGFSIPDLAGLGVQDTLFFDDHMQIFEADVYVDITHPRIGDLFFFVWSPRLYRVVLHNRTGGDADNIVGWYDDDFTPDGPGNFGLIVGDSAQGRWIFYISDRASGEAGTLNSWGVRVLGTGAVDDIIDDQESRPEQFVLMQNYPNPFNPSTKISFMLADSGPIKLEIYDLLGRKMATLLDKEMTAGLHSAEWNGRTAAGMMASSGVYFARLSSGEKSHVIRMSLLK